MRLGGQSPTAEVELCQAPCTTFFWHCYKLASFLPSRGWSHGHHCNISSGRMEEERLRVDPFLPKTLDTADIYYPLVSLATVWSHSFKGVWNSSFYFGCPDQYWQCYHFSIKEETGICGQQQILVTVTVLGSQLDLFICPNCKDYVRSSVTLWKAVSIIQSTTAILNCNMTNPSLYLLILHAWWQSLEKTPFAAFSHSCTFSVKQFLWILRLLWNSSFQSVPVRVKCWDSLTMNPKRPGEEIIKENVLHHVFRKLSVDAITVEENSRSYSLKVAGINVKSYTWI